MDKLNLYVGHPEEATRETLIAMVEGLDHEVVGSTCSGREMVQECKRLDPDLIISGVQYDDMDGIRALIEISQPDPKPSIVVAKKDDLQDVERAMDDHVMAYLIDPVTADDLRPTIYVVKRRFEQFQDLKAEVADLRDAMAVRKVVERAKGILMKKHSLDEEAAYLKLRKMATDKGIKVKNVAEFIIELES